MRDQQINRNNFPRDIREVERRDAGVIKSIIIDLSIAQNDFEYGLAGNFFYIWEAPDGTYIDIKINETRETAVSFVEQTGFKTPFDKLYITTPAAQTGTLILLYGTESPELAEIIDNRGAISGDLATIRDELRGDTTEENWGELTAGVAQIQVVAANANRKSVSICSDIDNTGNVYLGFDNTVTTRAGGVNWFHVLVPGGSYHIDDYRGAIHAIATAANQYIGYGEV